MFDRLDDLERAIDKVIASEQPLALPRLRTLADRLEGAWLMAVRAADRAGELHTNPNVSPAAELAYACRMSHAAARRTLSTARKLDELPRTSEAMLAGDVTPAHVQVMTQACTPERAEGLRASEPMLIDAAQRLPAREFSRVVRRVCDALDGDDGAGTANEQYDRRALYVSGGFEGLGVVQGQLDQQATEIVITALETRMVEDPDRSDEPKRTRPQRRADALRDICRHYLNTRTNTSGARRSRPHVGVTVSLELLEARGHTDLAHQLRGELEYTGAVSKATLERMTCDAHIHRIITTGPSQPLDVGRSTQTIPTAIRRALIAQDHHCQAPGCDAPAGWCDGHHEHHWTKGGETKLDNLTLLCRRHHHEQHEGKARDP